MCVAHSEEYTLYLLIQWVLLINPLVCMCDLVSIPTSCKETSPFPFKLLEKAVNIKWHDKIPDIEVLKKAEMQSM